MKKEDPFYRLSFKMLDLGQGPPGGDGGARRRGEDFESNGLGFRRQPAPCRQYAPAGGEIIREATLGLG